MADDTFYLGRIFDDKTAKVTANALQYDPADLTTHAVVTGMTGSGKTGLCVALLEEAALLGVPAIIIDPKGDLTNLLLHFPDLLPQDFQPWLDADNIRREGIIANALGFMNRLNGLFTSAAYLLVSRLYGFQSGDNPGAHPDQAARFLDQQAAGRHDLTQEGHAQVRILVVRLGRVQRLLLPDPLDDLEQVDLGVEPHGPPPGRGVVDHLAPDLPVVEVDLVADPDLPRRVDDHVPDPLLLVELPEEEDLDLRVGLLLAAEEARGRRPERYMRMIEAASAEPVLVSLQHPQAKLAEIARTLDCVSVECHVPPLECGKSETKGENRNISENLPTRS